MTRNMIKEVFIFIILLILVLLILAVSLYDYIPSNINISEIREYNADSKTTAIKQEIAYTNGGDSTADGYSDEDLVTSLKSYSIEASDLSGYASQNKYISGNSNPFDYGVEVTAPTTNPDANASNNANNSTTNNNNTNNSNANNEGQTNTTTTSNTTTPAGNNTTATPGVTNQSNVGTFFESPNSK